MTEVQKAGRALKLLVLLLLIFSPIIYLAVFIIAGPSSMLNLSGYVLSSSDHTFFELCILFFLPLFTPATYWLALYYIYKLSRHYTSGTVFSLESVHWIKCAGIFLLMTDFIYMVQVAMTGPLLSRIGLTENFINIELKLGTSIIGLFIILVSRIMLIAQEQYEQQKYTI